MTRFLAAGVPVIHLIRAKALADRYGLETEPRFAGRCGAGRCFRALPIQRLVRGGRVGEHSGGARLFEPPGWDNEPRTEPGHPPIRPINRKIGRVPIFLPAKHAQL